MAGSSPVPLRRWLAPVAALLRRRQSAVDPASPPGPPPMPRSEILARYRRLRQISKRQHEAVLDIIAPDVLFDWARRLDMTEGKAVVLENDNEMTLPEDLASRVAGLRCRSPAPSEPDVTIARHPAQASAARYAVRVWCAWWHHRGTSYRLSGWSVPDQRPTSSGSGRPAHHAVDAGCRPARVLLGNAADCEPLCGCRADQELLQVLPLPSLPGRRGTVDPILQSPHDSLRRSPINLGPRRLLPLAGLFGLHRLTSPAIPSSARLPNR